jgi:hypothetical protein
MDTVIRNYDHYYLQLQHGPTWGWANVKDHGLGEVELNSIAYFCPELLASLTELLHAAHWPQIGCIFRCLLRPF